MDKDAYLEKKKMFVNEKESKRTLVFLGNSSLSY
jgi:hypothetical protein